MASPFNLDKGGKVGRDEYAKLIAENMKRYGGDRDKAVRSANIKAGYGSSTAQRFLHDGKATAPKAGGGGGKAGGGGGGKAPTPSRPIGPASTMTSPSSAPGFLPNMTTPTSAPGFLPTQSPTSVENPALGPTTQPGFWDALRGPTTQPSDLPTLGPTTQPGFVPQNALPLDLAVSPPRPGENWQGRRAPGSVNIGSGGGPKRPVRFVQPNAPYAPAPFDSNNPEFTY
jgi:hypothetical protein